MVDWTAIRHTEMTKIANALFIEHQLVSFIDRHFDDRNHAGKEVVTNSLQYLSPASA
jgi:hypothetical protein